MNYLRLQGGEVFARKKERKKRKKKKNLRLQGGEVFAKVILTTAADVVLAIMTRSTRPTCKKNKKN